MSIEQGSVRLNVNLATEDKQDDIITKLQILGTPTTTELTLTNADTDYKLPTSELANRKTLIVVNNSDTTVYLGQTGVIDADASPPIGMFLKTDEMVAIDSSTGWYAQCNAAGKKLTIIEMA